MRTFWARNAAAKRSSARVKGAFVRPYTPLYTTRRTVARTALSEPTRMLAVIISLIVHRFPVSQRSPWMYPGRSFGFSPRPRHSVADLFEDGVIPFEVGREEVRGGIRASRGACEEAVLFEQVQMVPNRPIVEVQGLGELIRVARPCVEHLDDPCSVQTASGARDQEPQKLTERSAHGRPRAVREGRIKSVSCVSSPRGNSRRLWWVPG